MAIQIAACRGKRRAKGVAYAISVRNEQLRELGKWQTPQDAAQARPCLDIADQITTVTDSTPEHQDKREER